MKESQVQAKVMAGIRAKFPGVYLRKIAQGTYSHGGIPDLVGCLNGMFFAIEIKTNQGELSKLQALDLTAIDSAKGLGLVCYGIEDLPYIIERLGGL